MKYFVALVVGLTGTLVLGAPAQAKGRVQLNAPAAHHVGSTVVVTGKAKGSVRAVRIEQRRSGRWVLVKKAAVRSGAYKATVKAGPVLTVVRARAAGVASKAVAVKPVTVKPPAVTAPTPVATDACGAVLKKADGTAWSCTLAEDFNGTSLNRSVWMPQTNFAMGTQAAHACLVDSPDTINVSGGSLNLSVKKVATPVSCTFGGMSGPTNFASGGVSSYRLFSQQFGRFEARIKNTATTSKGLHEAFWLWPDDRVASTTVWPYAGEIDISETYSSYPTLSIPFLHYKADVYGNLPGINTAWNCAAQRGVFNTYTLEWSAKKIQIFVNGKLCLANTTGDSAFVKPYIMALTQGMGAAGNEYDGKAPLGTMNVDYVKVWK
ncbi:glycoside hydrolase family 16 protein [Marmoricola sp. OAE513]|uniref:glycoside hydrolase family 16 protein n=1 Tax=Marmoricola sp. OAE513 TaxID=2817894 RepID=UPI001AEAEA50